MAKPASGMQFMNKSHACGLRNLRKEKVTQLEAPNRTLKTEVGLYIQDAWLARNGERSVTLINTFPETQFLLSDEIDQFRQV
jgi:hypothetical protein